MQRSTSRQAVGKYMRKDWEMAASGGASVRNSRFEITTILVMLVGSDVCYIGLSQHSGLLASTVYFCSLTGGAET